MEQHVTPLETMRLASQGSLVTLPGFGDGDTITVRLRKPNMLTLLRSGKLPNELLNAAVDLFERAKKPGGTKFGEMADMVNMMAIFCEASLVEPTYKELTDNGIELTQEQMIYIFNFAQGGVKALKPFRDESGDSASPDDGGAVADTTESAA